MFMKVAHLEVLLETCVFSVLDVMMLQWDCGYAKALVLFISQTVCVRELSGGHSRLCLMPIFVQSA
jgi:hypothetical protein